MYLIFLLLLVQFSASPTLCAELKPCSLCANGSPPFPERPVYDTTCDYVNRQLQVLSSDDYDCILDRQAAGVATCGCPAEGAVVDKDGDTVSTTCQVCGNQADVLLDPEAELDMFRLHEDTADTSIPVTCSDFLRAPALSSDSCFVLEKALQDACPCVTPKNCEMCPMNATVRKDRQDVVVPEPFLGAYHTCKDWSNFFRMQKDFPVCIFEERLTQGFDVHRYCCPERLVGRPLSNDCPSLCEGIPDSKYMPNAKAKLEDGGIEVLCSDWASAIEYYKECPTEPLPAGILEACCSIKATLEPTGSPVVSTAIPTKAPQTELSGSGSAEPTPVTKADESTSAPEANEVSEAPLATTGSKAPTAEVDDSLGNQTKNAPSGVIWLTGNAIVLWVGLLLLNLRL